MISFHFHGELGNNLFQLATCLNTCITHNSEYECLNTRETWVTKPLEINSLFDYDFKLKDKLTQNYDQYLHNDVLDLNDANYNFGYSVLPYKNNVAYRGYFQSEKYFYDIKDELKNTYFKLNTDTIKYINSKYGKCLRNSISVHVRLGGDRHKCLDIFPVTPIEFYQNAIDLICETTNIENVNVFSDNMTEARKMFPNTVNFIEHETNIVDLTFMSMCSHNILGNSTFSWWGAWLNKNDNIVVVPDSDWFGGRLSALNRNDLFPSRWIKL